MTNQIDTMAVWNSFGDTDRNFTKPITGKSYKGDSPNPVWVIMKLTEAFGPVGQGWGWTVEFDRVREGEPYELVEEWTAEYSATESNADGSPRVVRQHKKMQIVRETYHELCIKFWFLQDGQTTFFNSYGGTRMFYRTNNGKWICDEDAAKKSLTDAIVKAASWLGVCADIFLGIYDTKYHNPPDQAGPPQGRPANNPSQPPQGQQQPPQGQPPQSGPPQGTRNDSNPF